MIWIFIKEFSEVRAEDAAANRVVHVGAADWSRSLDVI